MINLCDFNFIDPLLNDSQNTKENENPNSCIESLDEVADVNAGFKNLSTQSSQNQRIACIPIYFKYNFKVICIFQNHWFLLLFRLFLIFEIYSPAKACNKKNETLSKLSTLCVPCNISQKNIHPENRWGLYNYIQDSLFIFLYW